MTSSDGNGALCFRMAVKFMQDGARMPVILQVRSEIILHRCCSALLFLSYSK
jgi:hypothetical protein